MVDRDGRGFERRTVLKMGGALGVGAALAGCTAGVNPFSESDTDSGTNGGVGVVPEFAQGLAYGNVDAFLADSELRQGINQQLQTLAEQTSGYSGPTTLDQYLAQMEESAGVDPAKMREVLGFWGSTGDEGAVVLWTDWPESVVTSQFSGYTEEDYHGTTLYVPEYGGPGAVLDDGVYAVGSNEAVRSVVDVRDGRAQGLTGRLRREFETTQGMTRVAATIPDLSMADLTGEEASNGSQVAQTANSLLETVELASGSVHSKGTNRVMTVSLATDSADEAEALEGSLSAGRQLALERLGTMRSETKPDSMERLLVDRMVTFGRDASIGQSGKRVEVRYAAPPAEFVQNGPALLLAAGVFMNTAGFLQARAEETGQQSSDQAVGRVQAVNTVGEVVDGEIGVVRVSVRLAPGESVIDLDEAVVQAVTSDTVATLSSDGPAGKNFGVEPIKDDDDSLQSGVLNSDEDVADLVFDLGSDDVPGVDSSAIDRLAPGDETQFTVTTQAGGETAILAVVPESLAGKHVVTL